MTSRASRAGPTSSIPQSRSSLDCIPSGKVSLSLLSAGGEELVIHAIGTDLGTVFPCLLHLAGMVQLLLAGPCTVVTVHSGHVGFLRDRLRAD